MTPIQRAADVLTALLPDYILDEDRNLVESQLEFWLWLRYDISLVFGFYENMPAELWEKIAKRLDDDFTEVLTLTTQFRLEYAETREDWDILVESLVDAYGMFKGYVGPDGKQVETAKELRDWLYGPNDQRLAFPIEVKHTLQTCPWLVVICVLQHIDLIGSFPRKGLGIAKDKK